MYIMHNLLFTYDSRLTQQKKNEFWFLKQKLVKFEESIGVKFDHIRLLARAFTLRSVGYNHLTL